MMEQHFTAEEKKRWRFRKHLKDHLFEYVMEILTTVLYTWLLLWLCRAERMLPGLAIAFLWGLGRVIRQMRVYKEECLDVEIT